MSCDVTGRTSNEVLRQLRPERVDKLPCKYTWRLYWHTVTEHVRPATNEALPFLSLGNEAPAWQAKMN